MIDRPYPRLTVTEKAERSLRAGHPWVYGEEITDAEGEPLNGGLADVFTRKGRYMGTGFYNDHSKIRVRLISRNANDRFDEDFWMRRLRYAVEYRKTVMGSDFGCCRLIFGEADCFPGLTVDRFGDVLVSECLSLGMEMRKKMLFPMLVDLLRGMGERVSALYERNEAQIRHLEGEYRVWIFLAHRS